MNLDIYMVGVGGQGILTIGELVASAALEKGIPVNFYPSKGMAQRGGFVKAQLRLGKEKVGPNIPQKGADLVLSMEISEALKAVRFLKPGGYFVLFAEVFAPTNVMLGKAGYPSLEAVVEEIKKVEGSHLVVIDPKSLPEFEGRTVADNVFMLGTTLKHTPLGKVFTKEDMTKVIHARWTKGVEANSFALDAGMKYKG